MLSPTSKWRRQTFEYPSISSRPRAFRVLRLLPPTRSWFPPFRETLRMELIETDVDVGVYETISYCWGNSAADREVHVVVSGTADEYQTLYISASLESVILSLAHDGNLETRRPIFADQICVNQRDHVEKVQQVRLMGEIYTRSAKTIVWFGEETRESGRYFDFVSDLCSEGIMSRVMGPNAPHLLNVFGAVMNSSKELETEAEREDRDDILDLVARFGPRFPVQGLLEILRRAWVNRLWTVQEGCLPSVLTFRCGGKCLCFDCFRAGLLFYSIWTTYWITMLKTPVPADEVRIRDEIYTLNNAILRLRQERKAIHDTREGRRSLYEIVIMYNVNDDTPKIGATKAEDRIYALLGLAEQDELTRETMEQMEVDNVRGTYINFATSALKRNMDVLLFSQVPKSPIHGHELPSWVADWSAEHLRTPCGYSNTTSHVFAAGGSPSGGDFAVDAPTGTLRVNAIPVGRVLRVGSRSIGPDATSLTENVDFRSVKHFLDELDMFLDKAAGIDSANAPDITDEHCRLESIIRLSDGGLSVRQFPITFDPTTAPETLREIHAEVSRFGKFIVDTETQNQSLSTFTGMIRRVDILPWYWTPASEMDVTRLCATNPVAAARIWMKGLGFATYFVAYAMWCIGKVRFYTALIEFRQIRAKRYFQHPNDGAVFSNAGIHMQLVTSKEWAHYTSNLFKSIGRKCFLTDTGYVGLGPCHLRMDDAIVVIPGSSVPHVLRRQIAPKSSEPSDRYWDLSPWSYVGEAYCDGVMDGELVDGENKTMRWFEIR